VSQAGETAQGTVPGKELVRYDEGGGVEWADLRPAAAWARRHQMLLAALALIVIQVVLKAQFLSHLFFRQDDFHDLDLAVRSPLSWGYLTYIGSGHLIIGLRVIAWFTARTSLYNWGLASAISLAFVLAAGLAALRLLRTLFGERPAILIPLTFYLAVPLTLPDLGDWSSAMESVPLQFATLMAVTSHVLYLRTGRRRHLAAAAGWVVFGLLFFEKGMLLPFLLLAVTGAFFAGPGSWVAGSWRVLRAHWRAWLVYGAIDAGYSILLAVSLRTSASQPTAPGSLGHVAAFSTGLLRKTLLPGLAGGPWRWFPVPGGSFAVTAAPALLIWLAAIVVVIVVAGSIWLRRIAWRSWAILAGWVVLADMLPVVIGRLAGLSAVLLGLETRYVADAMPVAAICLGLAFLPVVGQPNAPAGQPRRALPDPAWEQAWRPVIAALIGLFVFGSFWSAQAYESVTTGAPAATYIGHAVQAVRQAPRGTPVFNEAVPGDMVEGLFGDYALQSTVIGDSAPGKLRWIRHPAGTIDGLRMFGPDGRLYQAFVYGAPSLPRPAGRSCWPIRHHQVVVKLFRAGPPFTGILRIGYLWLPKAPGQVTVRYGAVVRALGVVYGLHTAYVPVTGSASAVVIGDLASSGLCVGDVEVGNLRPAPFGEVLPHAASPAA
jgi:hypothetical protein